jgi:hypothetical protein
MLERGGHLINPLKISFSGTLSVLAAIFKQEEGLLLQLFIDLWHIVTNKKTLFGQRKDNVQLKFATWWWQTKILAQHYCKLQTVYETWYSHSDGAAIYITDDISHQWLRNSAKHNIYFWTCEDNSFIRVFVPCAYFIKYIYISNKQE